MIEVVIGALLKNYDANDPEWKFQAGFLAEILENGAPMPRGRSLSGICRVAGNELLTKHQIIKWGRAQETALN